MARYNFKLTKAIEALLLARGELSRGQIIGALHLPAGTGLHGAIMALKKMHGDRFCARKVGTTTRFSIHAKAPKRKPAAERETHFELPEDLWRGWVNPATGIIPERLGV